MTNRLIPLNRTSNCQSVEPITMGHTYLKREIIWIFLDQIVQFYGKKIINSVFTLNPLMHIF